MILVDTAIHWGKVSEEARHRGHGNKKWCHMTSDTSLEELHAFAKRLGQKKKWFQDGNGRHPHYDLTEGKRRQAVLIGAKEATRREIFDAWRKLVSKEILNGAD